jgi:polyhydroxyalkanoate synthase
MISAQWMKSTVRRYDLDIDGKRFLEFTAGQFIDALSPSNFVFSNPEVIRESLESGMSNIARGMKNFLLDIKKSSGLINIQTTDKSFFSHWQKHSCNERKSYFPE